MRRRTLCRSSGPATAADEVLDEPGAGQDAKRLEGIEHPAHTRACTIGLTGHTIRANFPQRKTVVIGP